MLYLCGFKDFGFSFRFFLFGGCEVMKLQFVVKKRRKGFVFIAGD